jgi:hypothetical protein
MGKITPTKRALAALDVPLCRSRDGGFEFSESKLISVFKGYWLTPLFPERHARGRLGREILARRIGGSTVDKSGLLKTRDDEDSCRSKVSVYRIGLRCPFVRLISQNTAGGRFKSGRRSHRYRHSLMVAV